MQTKIFKIEWEEDFWAFDGKELGRIISNYYRSCDKIMKAIPEFSVNELPSSETKPVLGVKKQCPYKTTCENCGYYDKNASEKCLQGYLLPIRSSKAIEPLARNVSVIGGQSFYDKEDIGNKLQEVIKRVNETL